MLVLTFERLGHEVILKERDFVLHSDIKQTKALSIGPTLTLILADMCSYAVTLVKDKPTQTSQK